jgi:hypothetical protein
MATRGFDPRAGVQEAAGIAGGALTGVVKGQYNQFVGGAINSVVGQSPLIGSALGAAKQIGAATFSGSDKKRAKDEAEAQGLKKGNKTLIETDLEILAFFKKRAKEEDAAKKRERAYNEEREKKQTKLFQDILKALQNLKLNVPAGKKESPNLLLFGLGAALGKLKEWLRGLKALLDKIPRGFKSFFDGFRGKMKDLFDGLKNRLGKLADDFKNSRFGKALTNLTDTIRTRFNKLTDDFKNSKLGKSLSGLTDTLKSKFSSLADTIRGSAIGKSLTDALDSFKLKFDELKTSAKDTYDSKFRKPLTDALDSFKLKFDELKTSFKESYDTRFKKPLIGVLDEAKMQFMLAKNQAKNSELGKSVTGFFDGIKAKINSILPEKAATSSIDEAGQASKKFLGIFDAIPNGIKSFFGSMSGDGVLSKAIKGLGSATDLTPILKGIGRALGPLSIIFGIFDFIGGALDDEGIKQSLGFPEGLTKISMRDRIAGGIGGFFGGFAQIIDLVGDILGIDTTITIGGETKEISEWVKHYTTQFFGGENGVLSRLNEAFKAAGRLLVGDFDGFFKNRLVADLMASITDTFDGMFTNIKTSMIGMAASLMEFVQQLTSFKIETPFGTFESEGFGGETANALRSRADEAMAAYELRSSIRQGEIRERQLAKRLADTDGQGLTEPENQELIDLRQNLTRWKEQLATMGMAQGGISYGPDQGYFANLHGPEMVVPLSEGDPIGTKMTADNTSGLLNLSKENLDLSATQTELLQSINDSLASMDPLSGSGGNIPQGTVGDIMRTIRKRESAGNYRAEATTSSASGAYQFIDGTWRSLTSRYGIGQEYSRAMDAPPEIQDAIAQRYVQQILADNPNRGVDVIPDVWFSGNPQGQLTQAGVDANRALGSTGPEIMGKYKAGWMKDFSQIAGTPVSSTEVTAASQIVNNTAQTVAAVQASAQEAAETVLAIQSTGDEQVDLQLRLAQERRELDLSLNSNVIVALDKTANRIGMMTQQALNQVINNITGGSGGGSFFEKAIGSIFRGKDLGPFEFLREDFKAITGDLVQIAGNELGQIFGTDAFSGATGMDAMASIVSFFTAKNQEQRGAAVRMFGASMGAPTDLPGLLASLAGGTGNVGALLKGASAGVSGWVQEKALKSGLTAAGMGSKEIATILANPGTPAAQELMKMLPASLQERVMTSVGLKAGAKGATSAVNAATGAASNAASTAGTATAAAGSAATTTGAATASGASLETVATGAESSGIMGGITTALKDLKTVVTNVSQIGKGTLGADGIFAGTSNPSAMAGNFGSFLGSMAASALGLGTGDPVIDGIAGIAGGMLGAAALGTGAVAGSFLGTGAAAISGAFGGGAMGALAVGGIFTLGAIAIAGLLFGKKKPKDKRVHYIVNFENGSVRYSHGENEGHDHAKAAKSFGEFMAQYYDSLRAKTGLEPAGKPGMMNIEVGISVGARHGIHVAWGDSADSTGYGTDGEAAAKKIAKKILTYFQMSADANSDLARQLQAMVNSNAGISQLMYASNFLGGLDIASVARSSYEDLTGSTVAAVINSSDSSSSGANLTTTATTSSTTSALLSTLQEEREIALQGKQTGVFGYESNTGQGNTSIVNNVDQSQNSTVVNNDVIRGDNLSMLSETLMEH